MKIKGGEGGCMRGWAGGHLGAVGVQESREVSSRACLATKSISACIGGQRLGARGAWQPQEVREPVRGGITNSRHCGKHLSWARCRALKQANITPPVLHIPCPNLPSSLSGPATLRAHSPKGRAQGLHGPSLSTCYASAWSLQWEPTGRAPALTQPRSG